MRDTGFDGVKPSREPASVVRFAGFVLNFDACLLATRVWRQRFPLHEASSLLLRMFVRQTRTGNQPRHSVGRLHGPAFDPFRPQHRRARGEAPEKDRGRSQAASPDRHRAWRRLPLRRADAVFVARAKAFHRCPGVAGRRWTPRYWERPWERPVTFGASWSGEHRGAMPHVRAERNEAHVTALVAEADGSREQSSPRRKSFSATAAGHRDRRIAGPDRLCGVVGRRSEPTRGLRFEGARRGRATLHRRTAFHEPLQ